MSDVSTALTLLVPTNEHIAKINEIRSVDDRAYHRWPPHINILFPFDTVENFPDIAKTLSEKLSGFGAIELDCNSLGYFAQGKNITVHLKPSDTARLCELFKQVTEALPTIAHNDFVPHLTIGQFKKSDREEVMNELAKWLGTGIKFTVTKLSLLSRSASDKSVPFSVHTDISL